MMLHVLTILSLLVPALALTPITDDNIVAAVDLWFKNETACTSTFGHISSWRTGDVTYMRDLFMNKNRFNEDLSQWDTSNVVNMR